MGSGLLIKISKQQKTIVALTAIVCLLVLTLIIVGTKYVDAQKKLKLAVEINELKAVELNASLQKLRHSEQTAEQIKQYLAERGVKELPPAESQTDKKNTVVGAIANAGGPLHQLKLSSSFDDTDDVDITTLFDMVRHVPLGYSHRGTVTSNYGHRYNPFGGKTGEFHSGMDFSGKTGAPVKVTADGVVTFARVANGYGNVVKIKHGYGYSTVYAHLSKIKAVEGQKVKAGDIIGLLGSTGRSSGPHLHYEVRLNDELVNPAKFLSLG